MSLHMYDLGQSQGGLAYSHEQARGVELSSHESDFDSHYEAQPGLRGIMKHCHFLQE